MEAVAVKGVVDLVGGLNKVNKLSGPSVPKQFHSGSIQDVSKFNKLMNAPSQSQNVSKLSDLGEGTTKIGGGASVSSQAFPAQQAPGDTILKGIQKMRVHYQGEVNDIQHTITSAKSPGGLGPTEMIVLNASLMKMQLFTTGVTSVQSNIKGTLQQLMSAQ